MRFSLKELLSDMSADATTIGFDMPGGAYDRFHAFLERQDKLPRGKAGRTAVVAVMVLASRLMKQQFDTSGPIANFIKEISDDAVREEAKRILESANAVRVRRNDFIQLDSGSYSHDADNADALWEMDDAARTKLLEQFRQMDPARQKQVREQMLRANVKKLAVLAEMSPEDFVTIMNIVAPEPKKPVTESVCSAMDTLTARLNRWAGC